MSRTSTARLTDALPLLLVAVPSPAFAAVGIKLVPEIEILALNFVVLLLLIYPVNRLLVQPLMALLAERERRSAGASARTDELRQHTGQLQGTLSDQLATARSAAQGRRREILTRAQQDEREELDAAREEASAQVEAVRSTIAEESETARSTLESDARELAREAAAGILGRAL